MRVAIAGRDKNYFSLIAKSVYKQKSLPFNSVCFGENAKDVMRIVQKEKPVLLIWDIEGQ